MEMAGEREAEEGESGEQNFRHLQRLDGKMDEWMRMNWWMGERRVLQRRKR